MSGYFASAWPAEDGGPARTGRPRGIGGPQATTARLAAKRDAPLSVMLLHGAGGALYVLRASIGPDAVSWVERIDAESLEPLERSPDLALGPFWPGGFAVLDDGALLVVQGRHAHRLGADLTVEQKRVLPHDAPYNSFVLFADGTVATKDLRRPGEQPSTVSLLDPVTLDERAAPVTLPEPCVARSSAHGDELFVVGVDTLSRWAWDGATLAARADCAVRYRTRQDQSFGWDPVIDAGAVWWMDNGDHTFVNGFTMLGNGVADGPVRLWRAALDDPAAVASVEISGRPRGAVTNPPLVDPVRGVAVAFDSANGVLAGFGADDLSPRWRIDLGAACHMIHYADTGELLVNDFDPAGGDALAVVDIETGRVTARAVVESPAQSVVFPAPGLERDAYFVSLSTIARVVFE